MIPIPRIMFEYYVKLLGEDLAKALYRPAPLGMFI